MGIASFLAMTLRASRIYWLLVIFCGFIVSQPISAQAVPAAEAGKAEKKLDEKINDFFEPATACLVQHKIGACGFTLASPVIMPTWSGPNSRHRDKNFSFTSALIGQV